MQLQVYKARWQGLLVAVKILSAEDSSQQDDFRKEVAMLEGLRHTHIVNYLGHLFQESGEVRMLLVPTDLPLLKCHATSQHRDTQNSVKELKESLSL